MFLSRAAYVEFMRKEAADNALSLDGTSFMSRILKVLMSALDFSYLDAFPLNCIVSFLDSVFLPFEFSFSF